MEDGMKELSKPKLCVLEKHKWFKLTKIRGRHAEAWKRAASRKPWPRLQTTPSRQAENEKKIHPLTQKQPSWKHSSGRRAVGAAAVAGKRNEEARRRRRQITRRLLNRGEGMNLRIERRRRRRKLADETTTAAAATRQKERGRALRLQQGGK